jgi:hypothetical protein
MRRWGDSGQIGPLEGILLLGAMAALGLGIGSAVNYATNELSGPGKPDPIRPAALATFRAPVDNDCSKRVLGDYAGTVQFANGVWKAPDTPTPKLEYLPDERAIVAYNKEVAAWNSLMKDRVGVVVKEIDNHDCNKSSPPTGSSSSSSSESKQQADINGTYDVQFSNGGGPCAPAFPGTLDVRQSGTNVTITRGDDQSSITAPLQSDLSFSYDGPDSKGNHTVWSGQFSQGTGGDVLVRGSEETTFSGGAQKSCSYDVFGKRR